MRQSLEPGQPLDSAHVGGEEVRVDDDALDVGDVLVVLEGLRKVNKLGQEGRL